MSNYIHSAENWFSKGERISYNPKKKMILKPNENKEDEILNVFHRIVNRNSDTANSYCITLLPGFPDGSFGWTKIEQELAKVNDSRRLYVEYIGQGDSDKPENYHYSTMERADLVKALWAYSGIEKTFVVTFDYSSLVALELLRRQQEHNGSDATYKTQISRVLLQIVHQLLWQVDIDSEEAKHGLRYVVFFNYVKNEKLIPNIAAGVFYRWQNDFTGIQFVRIGAGLAYIIDIKHVLNFSYFLGITNTGPRWTYQGIPFIQLVININKEYKYLPAKYINF